MRKACEGTSRPERKTVEKNRRLHMKKLCSKLASLVPTDASPDSKRDHLGLDQATSYIKNLQERVEELRQRKEGVARTAVAGGSGSEKNGSTSKLPIIDVREVGQSTLETLVICGSDKRFVFYDIIAVVEEEGAEVANASSSVVDDKIFYTIHSHIRLPRIGLEASRVSERLKRLIT